MSWQERIDAVWAEAGDLTENQVVEAIDALVAERPATDAVALFEAAGARDHAGREAEAEPLYRRVLEAELREHPEHDLADAARAFLALAQHDAGRHTDALQLALGALAAHLPQYGRAVSAYASELRAP